MRTPKKDQIMHAIGGQLAKSAMPAGADLADDLGLSPSEIDAWISTCASEGLLRLDTRMNPPVVAALTRAGERYLRGGA